MQDQMMNVLPSSNSVLTENKSFGNTSILLIKGIISNSDIQVYFDKVMTCEEIKYLGHGRL